MESRNRLGIYIRKDRATVVHLAGQGREKKLLDAFSVTSEEAGLQALTDAIIQACAERDIKGAEAAVALDCALFMQHSVHSDFSDYKKIAATVRFDTEEALATDVSEMAVVFSHCLGRPGWRRPRRVHGRSQCAVRYSDVSAG